MCNASADLSLELAQRAFIKKARPVTRDGQCPHVWMRVGGQSTTTRGVAMFAFYRTSSLLEFSNLHFISLSILNVSTLKCMNYYLCYLALDAPWVCFYGFFVSFGFWTCLLLLCQFIFCFILDIVYEKFYK